MRNSSAAVRLGHPLTYLAEAMGMLRLGSVPLVNPDNPDGTVGTFSFGRPDMVS